MLPQRESYLRCGIDLWPSHQDAQERSGCRGRAKSRDRSWEIGTGVAGLGGLSEAEHLVRRTAESHDPIGLSLSRSTNDLSSPVEGISRRSHRVVPLLLQFRQAQPGTEIRARNQEASHAGWAKHATADVKRDFLIEDSFSGVQECPIRAAMHSAQPFTFATRGMPLAA